MVVAGGFDSVNVLADVEVISLDPVYHPVPDCLRTLQPLPVETYSPSGGVNQGTSYLSFQLNSLGI